MCSIVVASRVWAQWPLVVAANRDESLQRPSEGPTVRAVGDTTMLGPRDLQAGGSWLGLNAHGVFVGITNRFAPGLSGQTFPGSRGQLVLDALSQATAGEAAARIDDISPGQQGPFHLITADRDGAALRWSDTTELTGGPLRPGFHILTERSFDAAPTQREPHLAQSLEAFRSDPLPPMADWVAQWRALLSRHDDQAFEGTCVHAPDRGYGTRSTTVLMLGADGRTHFFYADGPPCVTPLVEQVAGVAALERRPGG
ncbi:MAG: NRDE family protein [Nannocystaceae bacterium]|nr:NRDE family protein [Nannocystaceae bacterium]